MIQKSITPVILSGGAGTRLWPLSRAALPKQLLPITNQWTLIQETARRVRSIAADGPLIICSGQHRFLIGEQMRKISVDPKTIVLEPEGRNTAPAAAVASFLVSRSDPEGVIVLLPSDHKISDEREFRESLISALAAAEAGLIVTFGISPAGPETGYGYIEQGERIEGLADAYLVKRFVEKPDLLTARQYLAAGGYSWNSGMFVFRADVMLAELAQRCPGLLEAVSLCLERSQQDGEALQLDAESFKAVPSISIDYAVMEHTNRAAVVPCDIGWSDVGSWAALWDLEFKGPDRNVFHGHVVSHNTSSSYVHSPKILTALVGVKDLVVVATDDAILIADKNSAQDVKHVVDTLKAGNRPEATEHKLVHRPWGTYQTVDSGPGYQVKQIVVYPGGRLSLQMHQKRAEHWTVVEGEGRVTRDNEVFALKENESTIIPLGAKHRLENLGEKTLKLIEVQCGSYLGEDDIVRFDDIYGRAPKSVEVS